MDIKSADKKPEKYKGDTENWEKAEQAIINASKDKGLNSSTLGTGTSLGSKFSSNLGSILGGVISIGSIAFTALAPRKILSKRSRLAKLKRAKA